jgi:hypothetical protein
MRLVLSMIALGVLFVSFATVDSRASTCSSLSCRDRHASNSAATDGSGDRSVLLGSFRRLQLLGATGVSSLTTPCHEFRSFQIGKEVLAYSLHNIAEGEIGDHDRSQFEAELRKDR